MRVFLSSLLTAQCTLLLCALILPCCCVAKKYTVDAPCGKIRGKDVLSVNSRPYAAFRSIPYAKPPVGELRFKPPEPLPKFDKEFDATTEVIPICPQPEEHVYFVSKTLFKGGQEDCLVINVYAPTIDSVKRKVIVFIHGGGFVLGSSREYIPGTFVTGQDVIIVTFNYRIGVLGFLSTEDEASPGNYGLWDQSLALRWVKENIAAFGGDPDDVTISGESAGGASVNFHSISPFSKGLFTKVWAQSGTSTSHFARATNARSNALVLAKSTNCWEGEVDAELTPKQSQSVVDCLRKADLASLIEFAGYGLLESKFVPRVDGIFLPKLPSQLLQDKAYLESVGFFDYKYLVALNNAEISIFPKGLIKVIDTIKSQEHTSVEEEMKLIDKFLDDVIDAFISSRFAPVKPSQAVRQKITEWHRKRYIHYVENLITDLSFLLPSYDLLNALTEKENTESWFLYFNDYPHYMKGNLRGTPHAADLLYWFDLPVWAFESFLEVGADGELDEDGLYLKYMFSTLVGDFVKTGNLTSTLDIDIDIPSGWPTYDPLRSHYLAFDLDFKVMSHLGGEVRDFWLNTVPEWLAEEVEEGKGKDEL